MITDDDLERLLSPVSGDSATGDNLEYDPAFFELERAAAGKEEQSSGGEVIPAEEPDWTTVRRLAFELFDRTKDLRVAVHLVSAETVLSGLAGLAGGMALIRRMLEQYWDEVHPRLEAEEDYDPIMRINALAALGDMAGLLGIVRRTWLVEARSVGRFSFRDLDIAEQRVGPREGETPPTLDLLKAALREAGSEEAEQRLASLQRAREDLRAVEAVFRERAAGGQSPDISALDKTLGYGIAFLETGIERNDAAGEALEADDAGMPAEGGAAPAAAAGIGPLRNRGDVKRVLEQVCEFLERTEPSNPAPLLIRRACRLLDRSFIDIIQDLAPDAYGQIEKLAGITSDEVS